MVLTLASTTRASQVVNVFGRFSLNYYKLSGQGVFGEMQGPGNGLLGLSGSSITHNYSLATGFTKTFSSSLADGFSFWLVQVQPATAETRWRHSDVRLRNS